jgi:hypothetical protein
MSKIPPAPKSNVMKLSIRALILEGFEKGSLPRHPPKTFKSFRKGVQGENPFSKGFSPCATGMVDN